AASMAPHTAHGTAIGLALSGVLLSLDSRITGSSTTTSWPMLLIPKEDARRKSRTPGITSGDTVIFKLTEPSCRFLAGWGLSCLGGGLEESGLGTTSAVSSWPSNSTL